jgi:solute carrier family 31 (copper transporter), member 1
MSKNVPAFCTGTGRVMLPGFQNAASGGPCILFLFVGWAVDSPFKYVIALFASFFMGFSNEGFSLLRRRMSIWFHDKTEFLKILTSFVYGVQMTIAYWMMLLVMTYEIGVFLCLIFGLFVGNFVFSLKVLQGTTSKTEKSEPELLGGTTPCCQGNESKGLLETEEI